MIVVTKPGVQKPHCSPWQSWNACCTATERAVGVRAPLDGGDLLAVDADGEKETGSHRLPADEDGARAADAVLAADVRARQAQVVPQRVGQQASCRYSYLMRDAVDGELDVVQYLGAHALICVARSRGPHRAPRGP